MGCLYKYTIYIRWDESVKPTYATRPSGGLTINGNSAYRRR